MVDHLLLVSVVVGRDQTYITIIVRMMLGSVRAGANIFHFNLISLSLTLSIIENERRLPGQLRPNSNNISGTNRLCAAPGLGLRGISRSRSSGRSSRVRRSLLLIGRHVLGPSSDWWSLHSGGVRVTVTYSLAISNFLC